MRSIMDAQMQQAFENYFNMDKPEEFESDRHEELNEAPKPTLHFTESVSETPYAAQNYADGNISDVEQLADILKRLCNAAWGTDWGELSPDIKTGENSDEIKLPQITVDINTRDITEGMPLKPTLVSYWDEEDGKGNKTGETFLIYRQWFDCNVEFDIYGRNSKEARDLMKKFELLIATYTGYLKRQGVSEIIFEREVSPKNSLNYAESVPMRSIYYYVRLESISLVKQSILNQINMKIGAAPVKTEKVQQLLSSRKETTGEDLIDFDFFNGSNGITYKQ